MRHSQDWMSLLATLVLFVLLGLAGLAALGLLTGVLLFLAIFAVGLAVVGSIGFAFASVLRFAARRRSQAHPDRLREAPRLDIELQVERQRRGVPQRP